MEGTTEVAPVVVDTAASDTSTTTQDAAPAPAASEPADEWKGEVEGLDKHAWYTGLPEDVRVNARKGMEGIYRGWQQAWTKKNMTLAEERKAHAAEVEKAKADAEKAKEDFDKYMEQERIRVMRMHYGEDDPVAEARKEWEAEKKALEESHAAKETEYKTALAEWEAKHGTLAQEKDAAIAEVQAKLDALQKQKDEEGSAWQKKYDEREGYWNKQVEDGRSQIAMQVLDGFEKDPADYMKRPGFIPQLAANLATEESRARFSELLGNAIQKAAPDVFKDDDAFEKVMTFIDAGSSVNDAIKATRAIIRPDATPTDGESLVTVGAPGGRKVAAPETSDLDWSQYMARELARENA